jgi:hypothetical protein
MRKAMCPVCTREVPKRFIRQGAFPCPCCKAPLRFRGMSRLLAYIIGLCGVFLAFLMLRLMGLEGNTMLFAMIILFAPAGITTCAVAGAVQGFFFPRLEKDSGEDSPGFLHIAPRSGPPKARE